MGKFSDFLFTILLGWVKTLSNAIWGIFTNERGSLLEWLGEYWLPVCIVLVAIGLAGDWLIWLIRWRPYHAFAMRAKRVLGIEDEDLPEESGSGLGAATVAEYPEPYQPPQPVYSRTTAAPAKPEYGYQPASSGSRAPQGSGTAYPSGSASPRRRAASPEVAEEMSRRASSVPDESLREYPGMRHASADPSVSFDDTIRYSRPAGQEDEQTRYQRELMEYEVKRARYEQDLAEWQRAQQAAEQARYEQELEEYRNRRAKYALDMAAYERDLAEYERTHGSSAGSGDAGTASGYSQERRG